MRLALGQQQKFTASVSNSSNTAVQWSVSPNGGTITADGLYTAPATPLPNAQPIAVTATSVADPTKSAFAVVSLPVSLAVFGSGVMVPGILSADSTIDLHYTIQGAPAYVSNSQAPPFPVWIANGPASKWITPAQDANTYFNPGAFVYRSTFDLTGLDPSTARITGTVAADYLVTIQLNGVQIGYATGGWWGMNPFVLDHAFVPGINTLDFVVQCLWQGPTGLRLEMSGVASQP